MKSIGLSLLVLLILGSDSRPDDAVVAGKVAYRGFSIDARLLLGRGGDREAIERSIEHQVDIAVKASPRPDVLEFFRKIPIIVVDDDPSTPGRYANKTVFLQARVQAADRPILLHELLHAYHDLVLPGGVRNPKVVAFYREGLETYRLDPGVHFLENPKEFFAIGASIYLFGAIKQPPFTVESIREGQPAYWQYLAGVFREGEPEPPHGEVRVVPYRSGKPETKRRMHVYTPPGYEGGAEAYPVLYLLHAAGDDDSTWSKAGRVGPILDDLIAAKKARPMIVVMPNGNPTGRPNPSKAAKEAAQDRFVDELIDDVIPAVEKTFRTKPGPTDRAIAGPAMGAGQALRALATHPDKFAFAALWGPDLTAGNVEEWAKRNEPFLSAAEKINATLKRLEIRVDPKNPLAPGSKALAALLEKRGIKRDIQVGGGGQAWANWRDYLGELAPKLFP